MTLQEINYFLTLCEEKSFSSAAEKLFITQQGLSKSIKKLEDSLTFPLFERDRHGLTLTEYGEEIYPLAKEFEALNFKMDARIEDIQHAKKCIRVGVIMGALLVIPEKVIAELRSFLSPCKLELTETTDSDCEDLVERGLLNFGITLDPVDPDKFISEPIYTQPMYAVVNESHPLSNQKYICFNDLKREKFILANNRFKCYYNFIECCKKYGFHPNIAGTTMDMTVIYNRVLQNNWIGISADMVNTNLSFPGVKLIPFRLEDFAWKLILISQASCTFSRSEKEFVSELKKLMSQ